MEVFWSLLGKCDFFVVKGMKKSIAKICRGACTLGTHKKVLQSDSLCESYAHFSEIKKFPRKFGDIFKLFLALVHLILKSFKAVAEI